MSQMKTFLFIVLVIYPNSYYTLWAQTANIETTTQLSGNTEPLTQEMTQTPKTDNRTEYETNIQNFELKNTSSDTTTVSETSIELAENNTKLIYTETTTNSPTEQESQTQNFDLINSSSLQTMNDFKDFILSTTYDSIVNTNQSNNNPNNTSNNSSNANQLPIKTSKSLNFMNNETNEETFNAISDRELNSQQITAISTPNITTSSANESSAINSYDNNANKTTTPTINSNYTPNWTQIWSWTPAPGSQLIINSSPPMIETTQLYEINSRQTDETSTHKTSAQTTQGIQTTTINTFIESNSRPNTRESAQITQMPINSAESQTLPYDYHILSALETRDKPIDENETNQTYYSSSTQIPLNSNSFASEISNASQEESALHFYPPITETPDPNTVSFSSEISRILNIMATNESKEMETTQTMPQNETVRPITESIVLSNQSIGLTSESDKWNQSEPIQTTQTRLSTDLPESNSTEIPKSKDWILFQIHSTQTMSSIEAMVSENSSTQTTQSIESIETLSENQMTESSVGVLDSNGSQIIIKQPLTDRSLQTTQYIKPITTSIPLESNISTKTVTLPNIKYIQSISKEDMVNIVTITFISKSLDIFRWVSIYDKMFRSFTCNRIDTERDWCTIDRFVYLSPSPLVVNNHLICNFFIDDSTDNDLNNYHVFGGHLIVEALKNSTNDLETMMGMKVMSLQTNLGTMVVKPIPDNSHEKMAKFELLVFIFTVVMFVCTALLCLAIICSCVKRKSVDMNQTQLSNCGRRQTINGGFDLNSASDILKDENQEKPLNHNVITLDGWVAPIEQVECQKFTKYDINLENTKL